MRDRFLEHYWPTTAEKKELWRQAIFVFDANVLLRGYLLSPKARAELVQVWNLLREQGRLWIPYQFALEYHRNRQGKVFEAVVAIERAREEAKRLVAAFDSITVPFVSEELRESAHMILSELESSRKEARDLLYEDPYGEAVCAVFDGLVGPEPNTAELEALLAEGEQRYTEGRPPGFRDKQKGKAKGKSNPQEPADAEPGQDTSTAAPEQKQTDAGPPKRRATVEHAGSEPSTGAQERVAAGSKDAGISQAAKLMASKEAAQGRVQSDTRPYGDFLGWKQILKFASEKQAAIVFVTEDQKDDWWEIRGGETLGPLKALVAEFRTVVKKPFFMYDLAGFLTLSLQEWQTQVASTTLDEVAAAPSVGGDGGRSEHAGTAEAEPSEFFNEEDRPKARAADVDEAVDSGAAVGVRKLRGPEET